MQTDTIVVLALAAALVYLIWDTYANAGVEYVLSSIDGRKYSVRSLPDKQGAADLLATINRNFASLIKHMERTVPSDDRLLRIVKNYRPDALSEGADDGKYTSYSVNKGERLVFCLRARDGTNRLEDINTMMFVALHELAHLASESIGHTKEFWQNFKWILTEAINIGIYQDQDYKAKPKDYCGIKITDSPLHNKI